MKWRVDVLEAAGLVTTWFENADDAEGFYNLKRRSERHCVLWDNTSTGPWVPPQEAGAA